MKLLASFLIAWLVYAPFIGFAVETRYYDGAPPAVSAGPITFIGAAGNNFSATRSPTVNYPTCANGDALIAIFCADGSASYNGTFGTWATLGDEEDGVPDQTGAVFWKVTNGSESGSSAPWTNITAANETGRVIVLAFRNCHATTPINASNISSRGSSAAQDTTSITPSVNNCMIIGAFCIDPGAFPRTFTWDAGITEIIDQDTTPSGQNSTEAGIYIGIKLQTTAAGITLGGDFPAAENAISISIALEPL